MGDIKHNFSFVRSVMYYFSVLTTEHKFLLTKVGLLCISHNYTMDCWILINSVCVLDIQEQEGCMSQPHSGAVLEWDSLFGLLRHIQS